MERLCFKAETSFLKERWEKFGEAYSCDVDGQDYMKKSKLKSILLYLLAFMGQSRLYDLVLLIIQREMTEDINFDNLIKQFTSSKAKKANL